MTWMKLIALSLHWMKISLLIECYMAVINLMTKELHHFNVHHITHQRFSKIWRTPAIIFWVIMWSQLCIIYVYVLRSLYFLCISRRVLLYAFRFNFFCLNNGLEKKIKSCDWPIKLLFQIIIIFALDSRETCWNVYFIVMTICGYLNCECNFGYVLNISVSVYRKTPEKTLSVKEKRKCFFPSIMWI